MVAAALVLLCTKTAAGLTLSPWPSRRRSSLARDHHVAIREWAAAAGGGRTAPLRSTPTVSGRPQRSSWLSILLGVRDGCDWLGLSGAAANYLVQGGVYCLYASAALALLSLYIYMAGVIKYMN